VSQPDEIQRRVQVLLRELVEIGYRRAPIVVRLCECGCEDGAHHGVDGELHCSECSCAAFRVAETLTVAA
jgi:hypothetical protein